MKRLKAFTVLEIVLVMALTSIFLSILFSVLQRFNVAVSNEVKIKSELNAFFMMRSAIWKDLDQMDSLRMKAKNELTIYHGTNEISYKSIDNGFERSVANGSHSFPIALSEINTSKKKGVEKLELIFEWKNRFVTMSYPLPHSHGETINNYFIEQQWLKK